MDGEDGVLNRYLDATFCDDIRQETSGKLIFVGVYSSEMYVTSFPITLPKLSISIKAVTPTSNRFEKLNVSVYIDERVISEMRVDPEYLAKMSIEKAKDDSHRGRQRVQSIHFLTNLMPVPLEKECVIRVRAETEGHELRCPALQVLPAQPSNVESS